MRFCVDYRKLSNLTELDVYPLPRLDECIDILRDAVVLSTLDANSGYQQVSSILTTVIRLYSRMPFGLRNAPSTITRC
jgi:hypothetical protein